MIKSSQRFRRSSDVVHRRVAGESILVPIRGNVADMQRLYALDGVGEFAWELLDGRRGASDVAASIAEAFEVDPEQALADLGPFLEALLDQGLVAETDND